VDAVIPLYKSACPICGGDAASTDIELRGSCENCAHRCDPTLNALMSFVTSNEEELISFFEKVTGLKPWGAQRHWLKRLTRGENTVLIAPTGVGKTTLLMVYALHSVARGKRVLYVTPTKSLLNQTYVKVEEFAKRVGLDPSKILCYNSNQSRRSREIVLNRIENCDFGLLVVTNNFLLKNHEALLRCKVDVVIVDDVDSLIKNERGVYNLVRLLGYSERSVELAKRRLNLLWRILLGRAYGKNVDELVKQFIELDRELEAELTSTRSSQLVVASATGRSRGLAGRLLKDLLKVDLSGITVYGRNVTDSYVLVKDPEELAKHVLSVVSALGKGCLLYISPRHPLREAYERVVERIFGELEKMGLKASPATYRAIADFTKGSLDVLVGYSTYYGTSVRGLDSPVHIRYAIFLGTPVFAVSLESFLAKLNMLSRILIEVSGRGGDPALKKLAVEVRKKSLTLSPSERRVLSLCLAGKIPEGAVESVHKLSAQYREIKEAYSRALSAVKEALDRERVMVVGTMTLVRSGDKYLALIPDTMTYIQASGRTSRLMGNRMTRGFSLIVEHYDLKNLVAGLESRLKAFSRDVEFKPLDNVSLFEEKKYVVASREGSEGTELAYRSVLLVVESPTKAKTIARFFGRPSARRIGDVNVYSIPVKLGSEVVEFNVVATRGHVYDLTVNSECGFYGVLVKPSTIAPIYTTIKKCRLCGTQFVDYEKCPRCGSLMYSDSKQVIAVLRKLATEVEEVYIATDPDLEGEKIAYDVYVALRPFNRSIWRIELHEITLSELLKAIQSRRYIDRKLVEAEIYRRVLDRFLGFSLSYKLQSTYGHKYLGAGRVQTPVLGLVIERYREHVNKKCKKVIITTDSPLKYSFSIHLERHQVDLVEALRCTSELTVIRESEEVVEVHPKPPYTTDELLADAAKYGISVDVAMRTAQDLFESGLITYHRTDCTYVSSTGMKVASEYLSSRGLKEYFKPSHWGAQGTHEAVRPVYPLDPEGLVQAVEEGIVPAVIPLTGLHLKLYGLVFRRFIASQMKPFKAIKAVYSITLGDNVLGRVEVYTSILEGGFNLVEPVKVYSELKGLDRFSVKVRDVKIVDSSMVPLYSSGDVVLLMKRLSIGRPSTYSKILSSIRRHGYVVESKVKKKLIPTKRGIEVYEFLSKHYPELVSVEVTRKMEAVVDMISRGEVTGYEAIQGVLLSLAGLGLIEPALVPPLNLNGDIRLNLAFDNIATN